MTGPIMNTGMMMPQYPMWQPQLANVPIQPQPQYNPYQMVQPQTAPASNSAVNINIIEPKNYNNTQSAAPSPYAMPQAPIYGSIPQASVYNQQAFAPIQQYPQWQPQIANPIPQMHYPQWQPQLPQLPAANQQTPVTPVLQQPAPQAPAQQAPTPVATVPIPPSPAIEQVKIPQPTAATKPAETAKPAEAPKPTEAAKPAEAPKPAEAVKPAEAPKPADAAKPAEGATRASAEINKDLLAPIEVKPEASVDEKIGALTKQTNAIQEIAQAAFAANAEKPEELTEKQMSVLNKDTFDALNKVVTQDTSKCMEIINKDTSALQGADKDKAEKEKTEAQRKIANKTFGLFTSALLQKNLKKALDVEAKSQDIPKLSINDMKDYVDPIINVAQSDPTPEMRDAGIKALRILAQPETVNGKEVYSLQPQDIDALVQVLEPLENKDNDAKKEQDSNVKASAAEALTELKAQKAAQPAAKTEEKPAAKAEEKPAEKKAA